MKLTNLKNFIIFIVYFVVSLCLVSSCNSKNSEDNVIKIKVDDKTGVYSIPAKVNGLNLNFIFDTGATDVCLSLTEAIFMAKNGYLSEEDIQGSSNAQLADGSIAENTKIKLKSIEIGDIKIHNISALIVHNLEAPLLLGQSAIRKLGKIEFDGDYLYIHSSLPLETEIVIDKKIQGQLDSLVLKSFAEYKNNNHVLASKYIKEARKMAYANGIFNRNWELDFMEGKLKSFSFENVDEEWENTMPLYYTAFHGNEEKCDGIVITFEELVDQYSFGLAQHYSPFQQSYHIDGNLEEEFIEVVSEMLENEKNKYNAYCYCGRFYRDNLNTAKGYCEKAIERDDEHAEAYEVLGIAYLVTNSNNEKAREYFNIALSKKGCRKAYLHRLLAFTYPTMGNEYTHNLKIASRLGDSEAQRILKDLRISWE